MGVKVKQMAHKADNFAAICEQIIKMWCFACGHVNVSQLYGPVRVFTGIALAFFFLNAGL
jgi:hypothetical protein